MAAPNKRRGGRTNRGDTVLRRLVASRVRLASRLALFAGAPGARVYALAAVMALVFVTTSPAASGTQSVMFGSGLSKVSLLVDGQGLLRSSWIGCASCLRWVPTGSIIVVTADPAVNFKFSGWGGDCAGTAPVCVVSVDGNRVVRGHFARASSSLGLTVSGQGTIRSDPPGIVCGLAGTVDTCSAKFDDGSVVTLTPDPASGAQFDQWGSGCLGSGVGVCRLPISSDTEVTAAFAPTPVTPPTPIPLAVHVSQVSNVKVNTAAKVLNCAVSCSTMTSVTNKTVLTAPTTPDTVVTWAGGCVGRVPTCVVASGQVPTNGTAYSVQVVASTTPAKVGLKISVSGGGTVMGVQTGGGAITCDYQHPSSDDCDRFYPSNSRIRLQASPKKRFVRWGDPKTGDPCPQRKLKTCAITLNQPKIVTATFRK